MSATSLAKMGEDALVRELMQGAQPGNTVVAGVGDDCAVIKSLPRGWWELLKTDSVVEGVHFSSNADLTRVGWKAMARAISDIAAMAGQPRHALISLFTPVSRKVSDIKKLYAGLRRCAGKFGVDIVGGETTRSPILAIAVALTGRVRADRCLFRDRARAGDIIFVTGRLGGSGQGHHLDFAPRVAEAQWLAARFPIHAMMDLSDGLGRDLPRMALASDVHFIIDEANLPLAKGVSPAQAWGDGEDYELLFAAPRDAADKLESSWSRKFPRLPLSRIGRFVKKGLASKAPARNAGWDHFLTAKAQ